MALGFFKKLARGLSRTRDTLTASLQSVVSGGQEIDEDAIDDLEASLLAADLGPSLSGRVIEKVRDVVKRGGVGDGGVLDAVRDTLRAAVPDSAPVAREAGSPHVIFVVGVNGGGKTTSVGKLAARERGEGRSVIVVAADTFRAAAIDQLETWVERSGSELIRQRPGADPAAVVFDALKAAKARGTDVVSTLR